MKSGTKKCGNQVVKSSFFQHNNFFGKLIIQELGTFSQSNFRIMKRKFEG